MVRRSSDTLVQERGHTLNPNNYWGITLLSVLGKLFTRILNKRLDTWAEQYGIYVEAQYGFRKDRSTTDCVFVLNEIVNNFIQKGKKLFAFFIDYNKAFDCIIRENLWFKLSKCSVRGKMLNIIMSMYKCVKTRIVVNGEKSEPFDCKLIGCQTGRVSFSFSFCHLY